MISITRPSPRDLALIGVYMVVVIDIFASALTVPVMPFYVSQVCGCESMDDTSCEDAVCNQLGGPSTSLGFMFSAFAIAQLISNMWIGPLSDKIGRRAILVVTLGGSCVGMLGSSVAPTFTLLVASRIFIGFCSGTMSTANAYIADITTPKERPALMANVGTLLQVCFMFGPGVGSGLAELDKRAPFWVGSFTSLLALIFSQIYLKPPEELFPGGVPTSADEPAAAADKGHKQGEAKADSGPEHTDWKLVGMLALGALGSNTAMASLMTCSALYLQALFGFGSLEFGFVMMGQAFFSILVRTLVFKRIQERLGLMRTATVGALMGTFTYASYSMLDGSPASMYAYFVLAGVGTVGSTFSGSSVTPFFSTLGTRKNMGKIMGISGMMSSAGRVIGPPVFGALYTTNIRFPYRLAAACTLLAALVYGFLATITAARDRASSAAAKTAPLAGQDGERERLQSVGGKAGGKAEKAAVLALQELLAKTLAVRGYDLSQPTVVEHLKHLLEDALPLRVEGRSDEELLEEEIELVHGHQARLNRDHATYHPHHA